MIPLRFYYDRTQPRARAFANGSTNLPPSALSASPLPSRSRTRMPFRMQPMCRLTRRLAEVVLPPSTPPCPRRHPSRHAPPRTRRRSLLSKFRKKSRFLLLSALRSVQTLVKMLVFVIFLNVVLYATLPTYQPKHPRWYLPRYQPSSPPDPRHVKL